MWPFRKNTKNNFLYAWVGTADSPKENIMLLDKLADDEGEFMSVLVSLKERNIDLSKVYTKPKHIKWERPLAEVGKYVATTDGASTFLYKKITIQDIMEEVRMNGLPSNASEVVSELVNIAEGKKKAPVPDAVKALRRANREIEMERNGGHWTAMNRTYKDKSKYDRKQENKSWKDLEESVQRQEIVESITRDVLKKIRSI